MPEPGLSFLSQSDVRTLHESSLFILEKVGVKIGDSVVLERLRELGAVIDPQKERAHLSEELVVWALEQAGKQYILYGREPGKIARFGYGDTNLLSSPGQFAWYDDRRKERFSPQLENVRQAAALGDALSEINVVGGLGVPTDIPEAIRDVAVVAELVRHTGKPTRAFPICARSSVYVLEIYAALAGGRNSLRQKPMTEVLLDPISPLYFPANQIEIIRVFLDYGQPICVTPMALAGGTAPVTLAGALAQENAEALAGIVIVQALSPGHPLMVGGIPHILDPRTGLISFGSPEQGLMAAAMSQLVRSYGLPVYINVNLSDSKRLDLQAGMEKIGGLILGILSGADLFGHAGILGADQAGSLVWLAADHLAMQYARRVKRGLTIDAEHLAQEVIEQVGPGGNFMVEMHTVRHLRQELWTPNAIWNRRSYKEWLTSQGGPDMEVGILDFVDQMLARHQPTPLDQALDLEITRIVETARRELT